MPAELNDAERAVRRKTHETIRRVTVDIEERQHLNTPVSALMELVNDLYAFSDQTAGGSPGQHAASAVTTAERVETLAVVREAVEALVLMVSPYAPHMAEELWEHLGHRGGLTAAGWPAFDADAARAAEIVVPVQVNGKLRGAHHRAARGRRGRGARQGAGRSGRAGARRRQDRAKGDRGAGQAGQRGGELMTCRQGLGVVVAVLAMASSSCGYALAGRGSFLPAYIQTIGIPQFINTTPVYELEQVFTERVRTEFINRGNYKVQPNNTGVDALLTGEILTIQIQPASFTDEQQASRYILTVTAKIEFRDLKTNNVLWENPQWVYRDEYEATAGTDALDPNAFLAQGSDALERVGTEFAKAVVSAILEAF